MVKYSAPFRPTVANGPVILVASFIYIRSVRVLTEYAGQPGGLLQPCEAGADGLTHSAILVASVEQDGNSQTGTDSTTTATAREN